MVYTVVEFLCVAFFWLVSCVKLCNVLFCVWKSVSTISKKNQNSQIQNGDYRNGENRIGPDSNRRWDGYFTDHGTRRIAIQIDDGAAPIPIPPQAPSVSGRAKTRHSLAPGGCARHLGMK